MLAHPQARRHLEDLFVGSLLAPFGPQGLKQDIQNQNLYHHENRESHRESDETTFEDDIAPIEA